MHDIIYDINLHFDDTGSSFERLLAEMPSLPRFTVNSAPSVKRPILSIANTSRLAFSS